MWYGDEIGVIVEKLKMLTEKFIRVLFFFEILFLAGLFSRPRNPRSQSQNHFWRINKAWGSLQSGEIVFFGIFFSPRGPKNLPITPYIAGFVIKRRVRPNPYPRRRDRLNPEFRPPRARSFP